MGLGLYSDLSGAAVLITGGATGIGAAMVKAFAGQGARVAFLDIDEIEGDALADELNCDGGDAAFVACDLTDVEALRAAVDEARAAIGPAQVLVNNAADDQRHGFETVGAAEWDRLMAINLSHQFFAAQACAPAMAEAGGGAVINMTSNSYLLGLAGYPAYAAAKAGIAGLTKALARELGPHGIRVNAIAPGWVMTEKQKTLWLTPEAERELMEQQALKTQIEPEDVAELALFLASDASRMITGGVHVIDGGRW